MILEATNQQLLLGIVFHFKQEENPDFQGSTWLCGSSLSPTSWLAGEWPVTNFYPSGCEWK